MKHRMKKACALLLAALMLFSLSSCGLFSTISDLSESDFVYDAEKVQAGMESLTQSGYRISLRYITVGTEPGSEPEIQSSGFTIAASGELWYCEQLEDGATTTTILDFSSDTEFVTYTKENGETQWTRTATAYELMGDKETVKDLYQNSYISVFTGYGVIGAGLKDKGSATVAGRKCTKYAVSVSMLGASYNNEYYIDDETGLCLKNVIAVGAASEGSATSSYECTAFEVGYRITLPKDSECVTENGSDPDQNNPSGGGSGTSPELDLGAIMGGNGATDVIYGQLDEATKQALITEARKDGVELTFGADGSMTVVDPATGETVIQKPDGTWVIKSENGEEGQLGGNWPDNDFTKLLPKPSFPLLAATTSDQEFSVAFTDVTIEQIRDYVEQIKARGFTLNAETTDQEAMGMVIYMYEAAHADGYTLTITYTDGTSGVVVTRS